MPRAPEPLGHGGAPGVLFCAPGAQLLSPRDSSMQPSENRAGLTAKGREAAVLWVCVRAVGSWGVGNGKEALALQYIAGTEPLVDFDKTGFLPLAQGDSETGSKQP